MRTLGRALVLAAGASAILALARCDDSFVPGSVLTTFRPLAVRAEPPLAPPGSPVVLDALVFDPASRPISFAWYACEPAAKSGDPTACDDKNVIAALSSDTGISVVPEGVRALGTATTATYLYSGPAPASTDPARAATILLVARAGEDFAVSRKEIPIARPGDSNLNPQLEFIVVQTTRIDEDNDLSVKAGAEITWSAIVTSTSAEMFTRRRPDGSSEPHIEDIRFEWFTTEGRYGVGLHPPSLKPVVDVFVDAGPPPRDAGPREGGGESSKDEFGMKVTLNLPGASELTSDRVRVFVVVRDSRGGTTWAERSLRVRS